MRTKRDIRCEARDILAKYTDLYPVLRMLPIRVSARMTRSGGRAVFRGDGITPVEIVLSLPFFADEANDLHRTVTHEAAHIIAGHAAGHSYAWKRIHRSMGGKGDRCHTMSLAEGFTAKRHVRTEVPCGDCGKPVNLGPTQYKKHMRALRIGAAAPYRHKRCPR